MGSQIRTPKRKKESVETADVPREPRSGSEAPVRRLLELAGSGTWEGDLAEMRDDASRSSRPS